MRDSTFRNIPYSSFCNVHNSIHYSMTSSHYEANILLVINCIFCVALSLLASPVIFQILPSSLVPLSGQAQLASYITSVEKKDQQFSFGSCSLITSWLLLSKCSWSLDFTVKYATHMWITYLLSFLLLHGRETWNY